MPTISFKIDASGNVNLEVSGATGVKCEELTRAFEDALGTKVDSQHKPEYFVEQTGFEIHAEIHEG